MSLASQLNVGASSRRQRKQSSAQRRQFIFCSEERNSHGGVGGVTLRCSRQSHKLYTSHQVKWNFLGCGKLIPGPRPTHSQAEHCKRRGDKRLKARLTNRGRHVRGLSLITPPLRQTVPFLWNMRPVIKNNSKWKLLMDKDKTHILY